MRRESPSALTYFDVSHFSFHVYDYELDESQRRSGYELGTEQRLPPEMQGSMYSSHGQHAGQPQWAQGISI
jgi:hypothetical protein